MPNNNVVTPEMTVNLEEMTMTDWEWESFNMQDKKKMKITRFDCNVPRCGKKNVAAKHLSNHGYPGRKVVSRGEFGTYTISKTCNSPKMTNVQAYLHLWPSHPELFDEGPNSRYKRFECPACGEKDATMRHVTVRHGLPSKQIRYSREYALCGVEGCSNPKLLGGRPEAAQYIFIYHRELFHNVVETESHMPMPQVTEVTAREDVQDEHESKYTDPLTIASRGLEYLIRTMENALQQAREQLKAANEEIEFQKREYEFLEQRILDRDDLLLSRNIRIKILEEAESRANKAIIDMYGEWLANKSLQATYEEYRNIRS